MKKRTAALVAGLAFCAAAPLASAAPAAAAPAAVTDVNGVWRCTPIGQNRLCIRYINDWTGVDISYTKVTGAPIRARFFYREGQVRIFDNGYFTQRANERRSHSWNGTNPGCVTGFLRVEGQGDFATNSICPG